MSAPIVQARYEELEQIAARFAAAAEQQQALQERVNRQVEVLRSGGWQGKGVAAFLSEMDGEVGPAHGRLIVAQEESSEAVRQLVVILKQAEVQASSLFGDAESGNPSFTAGMNNMAEKAGDPQSGYLDSANINSTSEKRISDLKKILDATEGGRRVLEWLNRNDVAVKFGDAGTAIAYCTADGREIVLNNSFASMSDYELAAVLVHEGTHSLDSQPFSTPIIGPLMNAWYNFQDDFLYVAYPYPEEYRAHRAQAEFWQEIRKQQNLPPSPELDSVVDLIFDQNGNYRNVDAVYKDLHRRGYEGLVNP
ncbi:MAG TPA: hypothetical protein GYA08_05075 [Chloroflexi bacterium]|nr:hypothetical protein [Chloroflexota bacterium]